MALLQPPITGDPQLDSWTLRLTQQLNQGFVSGASGTGVGGGGGSGTGQPGPPGTPGTPGMNGNSVLYLYIRSFSELLIPTRPTTVTYDFGNDPVVSNADNGWSSDLPDDANGPYLWVTYRYLSETSGTITDQFSWDTPVLLSAPSISVDVSVRMRPADAPLDSTSSEAAGVDPLTWALAAEGAAFKNNAGAVKTLVASVYLDGEAASVAQHRGYTFAWARSGTVYNPTNNTPGSSTASRWVPVTADDVTDTQQFTCTVSGI